MALSTQKHWQKARHWLWQRPLAGQTFWQRRLLIFCRYTHLLIRDTAYGGLNLRAMSLVFTTFLGIIPVVALTFLVLKIVNAEDQLPKILNFLTAPFGSTFSQGITEPASDIAPQLDPKVLGTIGVGFLIYIALTLIQKIESAFNFIWHIEKSRGLLRRLGDYLVMLILLGIAISMLLSFTDSAMEHVWLKQILDIKAVDNSLILLNRLTPFLVLLGSITMAYLFIPNTRVKLSSALSGALLAGVLLNIIGWLFGAFVATSSNYQAVYSGFAITVLILMAIHLMWFVLLLGGRLAYYCNDERNLIVDDAPDKFHGRIRERLALTIMSVVGQQFSAPDQTVPWSLQTLADHLHAPEDAMLDVIEALEKHHLLDCREAEQTTLHPACALDKISLKQIVDAVREGSEQHWYGQRDRPDHPEVDTTIGQIENALNETLADRTVQNLINQAELINATDKVL